MENGNNRVWKEDTSKTQAMFYFGWKCLNEFTQFGCILVYHQDSVDVHYNGMVGTIQGTDYDTVDAFLRANCPMMEC